MKTHTERLVKRLRENKENPLICNIAADELLDKNAEIERLRAYLTPIQLDHLEGSHPA